MAQARSYHADTDITDEVSATEPQPLSKSGPGNWGVAARWFLLALLAIAFVACLYILF